MRCAPVFLWAGRSEYDNLSDTTAPGVTRKGPTPTQPGTSAIRASTRLLNAPPRRLLTPGRRVVTAAGGSHQPPGRRLLYPLRSCQACCAGVAVSRRSTSHKAVRSGHGEAGSAEMRLGRESRGARMRASARADSERCCDGLPQPPHHAAWYFQLTWNVMVRLQVWPGRSTVSGQPGWFGQSGGL